MSSGPKGGRPKKDRKNKDNPEKMNSSKKSRLKTLLEKANVMSTVRILFCVGGGPEEQCAAPCTVQCDSTDNGFGF